MHCGTATLLSEKRPGSHLAHVSPTAESFTVWWPAGQESQEVAPLLLRAPGAQAVHTLAPCTSLYVLGAHARQKADADALEK